MVRSKQTAARAKKGLDSKGRPKWDGGGAQRAADRNHNGRGIARGRGGRGAGRGGRHHRQNNSKLHSKKKPPSKFSINVTAARVARTVSNISDASSIIANNQQHNQSNNITTLPWCDPTTHYVPMDEEQRMLPVLIHWGESERGMMKDQPSFRLQKITNMLGKEPKPHNTTSNNNSHMHNNGNRKNNAGRHHQHTNTSYPTTQQLSLIQSLSLRRHHLKLLNPRSSMTRLGLGNELDIQNAAALFEDCVETYLRSHNVQYWTEADQKRLHRRDMPAPLTPDFRMKDGSQVMLSLISSSGTINAQSPDKGTIHPLTINWIEAKMFYGASTVPSGTKNAVGSILPKVKQYVNHFGTGAIVFMYGCGSQLAAQLLEVGVVALDGRCLDLSRVETHQRGWCADKWGNILF